MNVNNLRYFRFEFSANSLHGDRQSMKPKNTCRNVDMRFLNVNQLFMKVWEIKIDKKSIKIILKISFYRRKFENSTDEVEFKVLLSKVSLAKVLGIF